LKETESKVQSELYRLLTNILERNQYKIEEQSFGSVETEYPVAGGRADVCILLPGNSKAALVIECKRKVESAHGIRTFQDFDPMGTNVIDQAMRYATRTGAPYFATTNGRVFALFSMPDKGQPFRIDVHRILIREDFELGEADVGEVLTTLSRLYQGIAVPKTSIDWLFIVRLRSFTDWLSPHLVRSARNQLRGDTKFKGLYDELGKRTGGVLIDNIGRQAAYTLLNRIVFYRILERNYGGLTRLDPPSAKRPSSLSSWLRVHFDEAMAVTRDFEPIFAEDIYDHIPLPAGEFELSEIESFIGDMDRYKLEDIGADVVGFIYERLVPEEERHRLGQFYTPPQIAELIVQWSVRTAEDRVLDPATGSGTFLVKAYARLRQLMTPTLQERQLHRRILNQLYAVDLNPFPAQLTAMNLSMRDIRSPTSEINVLERDFFEVPPQTPILTPFKLRTAAGEQLRKIQVGPVDAVVANPPYTRWTEIPDRTKQAITKSVGTTNKEYGLVGKGGLRSGSNPGIYVYFLIHATRFLGKGGRAGMIVSNDWLNTEYGVGFGRFMLDHFKVRAVVDYNSRQFTLPLVATTVLLLEQCKSQSERDANIVCFAQVQSPVSVEDLLGAIQSPKSAPELDGLRVTSVVQSELPRDAPWSGSFLGVDHFLHAISAAKGMVRLGTLFDLPKGNITWTMKRSAGLGAREFFYRTKTDVRHWDISDYVVPALPNARYASSFVFGRSDWRALRDSDKPAYLFLCNERKGLLPKPVQEYVRWGETQCYTVDKEKRRKLASQTVASQARKEGKGWVDWYDLGKLEATVPGLFTIHNSFRHHRFMVMETPVAVDHGFITFLPRSVKFSLEEMKAVAAYLNSDFAQIFVEARGRALGGGTLSLDPTRLSEFPVPEVHTLPRRAVSRLASLFDQLEAAGRKAGDISRRENLAKLEVYLDKIDREVAAFMGMSEREHEALRKAVKALRERRIARTSEGEPETMTSGEPGGLRPPELTRQTSPRRAPSRPLERWAGN